VGLYEGETVGSVVWGEVEGYGDGPPVGLTVGIGVVGLRVPTMGFSEGI
jgi:hypothetical protein